MRAALVIPFAVAACSGDAPDELTPNVCATQMVADDNVLFGLEPTRRKLWRVPLTGDDAPTCSAVADFNYGAQLVQDDDNVYVNSADAILRAPKSVAGAQPLYAGRVDPRWLAMAGDTLFWREGDAILAAPAVGGTVTTAVATAPGEQLAADADRIYWVNGPELWSAPRAGGAVALVATVPDDLYNLAVDDADVWATVNNFEDEHGIHLVQIPKAGGAARLYVSENADDLYQSTTAFAVTSTDVVWAGKRRPDTEGAFAIRKGANAPRVLVSGLTRPGGLAVDDDHVYIADLEAPCIIWRASR